MSGARLLDDENLRLYLQPNAPGAAYSLPMDAPLMAAELLAKREAEAEVMRMLRAAGLQGETLWALVVAASAEVVRLRALRGMATRAERDALHTMARRLLLAYTSYEGPLDYENALVDEATALLAKVQP